jgi:hypothetical protein
METQDRPRTAPANITERISRLAWSEIRENLWAAGFARLGRLLDENICEDLRSLYARTELFRSRIEMERFRFGKGEYQYFAYPLPAVVAELRDALYEPLATVANEWMQALGLKGEFPSELEDFLKKCHVRGQKRPTPLVLHYRAGGYNCLHQDVYGEIVFPFQVIIALSRPDEEFTGGELLLVEQRPRAQSVGHVVRLGQGEAVVITTRYRPAKRARGFYRTNFRHGVSEILTGERYTLGVIFHDAL